MAEGQVGSTLEIAIESERFQPVSKAELVYNRSIAAVDEAMSVDQSEARNQAVEEFPLDEVLEILNFEGEITVDTIAAAQEWYAEYVRTNLLPMIVAQQKYYVAGRVVQRTAEEL